MTHHMKTMTLLLSIAFASIYFPTYAQLKLDENQPSSPKPPIVTKGFYSIGNNAEKLTTTHASNGQRNNAPSVNRKGYYAIAPNHQKLQKNTKAAGAEKLSKREIKKGYYSIGSNSEKLKRTL